MFIRISLELLFFLTISYSYFSLYIPNILNKYFDLYGFVFIFMACLIIVRFISEYRSMSSRESKVGIGKELKNKKFFSGEENNCFWERMFLFSVFFFAVFMGVFLFISFYEEKGFFWFGGRYGMFLLYLASYVVSHVYISDWHRMKKINEINEIESMGSD